MAFDSKVDYMALIQAAAAKGDDALVKSLSIQRAEKIAASPELTARYGNDTVNQLAKTWQKEAAITVADPVPAAAPVAAPAYQAPAVRDLTSDIQALYAAQRNSRLASLAKARDTALSSLSGEQAKLAPQFYNARNSTQAQSDISARNFAQYMAARGSSSGGAAAQARIAQEGVLQGTLGNLQGQEIAANEDIGRRMSTVQSNSAFDAAAAENDVAAAEAQARIAELQRIDGINLSQYNADRSYDRSVLESDRSYELQKKSTEASLAAQELDNQLRQAAAKLASDPNSPDNQIRALQIRSAQVELASAMELAKYAPAEAAARIAQIKASTSASYASAANAAADNTRQNALLTLQRDQFAWSKDPTNPDNIITTPATKQVDETSLREDMIKMLQGTETKDAAGSISYTNQMTPASVIAYLDRLAALDQITEDAADWIAQSIPSVKAYADAQTNRGKLNTRY